MTKKAYIAIADMLRNLPTTCQVIQGMVDVGDLTTQLANVIQTHSPRFNRDRWLEYIKKGNQQ